MSAYAWITRGLITSSDTYFLYTADDLVREFEERSTGQDGWPERGVLKLETGRLSIQVSCSTGRPSFRIPEGWNKTTANGRVVGPD